MPTRRSFRDVNLRQKILHVVLWGVWPQCHSQSVSQLFHGPAPRSPLHRLAVRLRSATDFQILAISVWFCSR